MMGNDISFASKKYWTNYNIDLALEENLKVVSVPNFTAIHPTVGKAFEWKKQTCYKREGLGVTEVSRNINNTHIKHLILAI